MTTTEYAPINNRPPERSARKEWWLIKITQTATYLRVLGLGWIVPFLRIAAGDSPRHQLRELWQQLVIPLIGITAFVAAWAALAPTVETSLGAIPGPATVWE